MRALKMFLSLGLGLLLAASAAMAAAPAAKKNPVVAMETTLGTIQIELYPDAAPATVRNFLGYVRAKHYDGLLFHRVIPNFMIQGGGLFADMSEKPVGPPIKNEADSALKNDRGAVAMARTQVVDSATAQFFINVKNNDFLNHRDETAAGFGYAVFGKVIQGMEVVDKIAAVPTLTKGRSENVPADPVVIRSARILEDKPAAPKP